MKSSLFEDWVGDISPKPLTLGSGRREPKIYICQANSTFLQSSQVPWADMQFLQKLACISDSLHASSKSLHTVLLLQKLACSSMSLHAVTEAWLHFQELKCISIKYHISLSEELTRNSQCLFTYLHYMTSDIWQPPSIPCHTVIVLFFVFSFCSSYKSSTCFLYDETLTRKGLISHSNHFAEGSGQISSQYRLHSKNVFTDNRKSEIFLKMVEQLLQ